MRTPHVTSLRAEFLDRIGPVHKGIWALLWAGCNARYIPGPAFFYIKRYPPFFI